jgi:hypothetical protein
MVQDASRTEQRQEKHGYPQDASAATEPPVLGFEDIKTVFE